MAFIGYEQVDEQWLAEKTRQTVRDWCPECEPEVDQTKEYVTPYRCQSHREAAVAGAVDWLSQACPDLYPNQHIETL